MNNLSQITQLKNSNGTPFDSSTKLPATISNLRGYKYTCKCCHRDYKEKFNYDRHIGFCEFSHKSIRERENGIDAFEKTPSINELFSFVKELVVRIDVLEKENAKLKQFTNINKRKMDFADWLNNHNKPTITFTKWLTEIPYYQFLDDIFKNDLISGSLTSLQNGNGCSNKPIYAFIQKPNVFYVYDEIMDDGDGDGDKRTLQWIMITGNEFDKWLNYISQSFLIEFKKWCDEHKNEIDNNEIMKEQYFSNFQKVLGNSKMGVDVRNQRIRQQYFNIIKQSFSG